MLLRGSFTCRDATLVSTSFSGGTVILSIFFRAFYFHFQIGDAQLSNKFREDLRTNYQRVENILRQLNLGFLCKSVCSDNRTFKAMSDDDHSSSEVIRYA